VRGGIYTNVVAEHRKKGWKPLPAVDLPAHGFETGLLR
jgi:7-cyano-7-deazaguanine reductase